MPRALPLIALLMLSCTSAVDDFQQLAQFRPEDKYFTASLKGLHFIIESSEIERVHDMFRTIVEGNAIPTSAAKCRDGTFTGVSPYDAYDYRHEARLDIRGGRIAAVDYDEVHVSEKAKQTDETYNQEMSASGTSPALAYPSYERQLLERQDLMQVDAVSGATYSLYRFRYAVALALMKASLGATAEN
ncbi:hypothetical protein ACFL6X_02070 [Candidatus Latescibacterota bacterium]